MNQPVQMQGSSQSGSTIVGSQTGPAVSAPKAPKAASGSGMSPGFQAYSKANQGNAQNRLTQAANSNLQTQGTQAKNAINQATNTFQQRVDAGSLANRQNAVEDVKAAVNAARNITAPVPTASQTPAAPAAPLSMIAQPQVDRFKEVINAQYQGPNSLRQAGLYKLASDKVNTAQTALDNSKTAQGREAMLKDLYQKRGDYTTGLNKLDAALLNANQNSVAQLKNTVAQQGNIGQQLDRANLSAANMAANRGAEIAQIQEQARNAFTTGKTAEETATEERVKAVQDNWNVLPDYLKKVLSGKAGKANSAEVAEFKKANNYDKAVAAVKAIQAPNSFYTNGQEADFNAKLAKAQGVVDKLNSQISALNGSNILGDQEAELLGLKTGQGLYDLPVNSLVKTTTADKERLVSKDEQLRQAALASLAGLDNQNRLDTNVRYNAEKAGTQTLMDAIDKAGIQKALAEREGDFQNELSGVKTPYSVLRGASSKPVNGVELLQSIGYNTKAPSAKNVLSNEAVAKAYQDKTSKFATNTPLMDVINRYNFDNRVNVQQNSAVSKREAALQALLADLQNKTSRKV
jgi:hypothetical protein